MKNKRGPSSPPKFEHRALKYNTILKLIIVCGINICNKMFKWGPYNYLQHSVIGALNPNTHIVLCFACYFLFPIISINYCIFKFKAQNYWVLEAFWDILFIFWICNIIKISVYLSILLVQCPNFYVDGLKAYWKWYQINAGARLC